MRSMWKGSVSFGLVGIPIHLYSATESSNISFRQVHATDGGRVHYKRVCSIDGEEVAYSETAKGYETDDGEMIVLTNEDFDAIPLPSTKVIDVQEFVPLESIDPIYFDKTYFLEPQKSGVKPYVLLRDALHKSGRVAVAKIALRQRESLAVLRVYSDVMVLSTMLWPEEVRTADFPFLHEDAPQEKPQELQMAGMLIDSMSDEVFDPDKYHDDYREAVEKIIAAKMDGREVSAPAPKADDSDISDLMAALSASVEASEKASGQDGKQSHDGHDGQDGQDGRDGKQSEDGKDGHDAGSSADHGSSKTGSVGDGTRKTAKAAKTAAKKPPKKAATKAAKKTGSKGQATKTAAKSTHSRSSSTRGLG